ncbi:MAG: SsrA-binding protein SmpB [Caldisericia bacterium]|nr:SsrA-binding protein SmpB [Caldisericia bacterium]
MKQDNPEIKIIALNKKATHNYTIIQQWEAGVVLSGHETKAIREGQVNFSDSYATIESGQVWIHNLHINADVAYGSYSPTQKRKLLLHKAQIRKIDNRVKNKGYTIIPLRIYFKKQWVKIVIALTEGKTNYDKRQSLKKKEFRREMRTIRT